MNTLRYRRLALLGLTGAGKSEAANYLAAAHGFQHCRTGVLCRKISQLVFASESKTDLGRVSDALRTIEPLIFLNAALRSADLTRPIVIDAIRYPEDLEYARRNGYRVIRIVARDADRFHWLAQRGQLFDIHTDGDHSSELALAAAQPDYEIENYGSRQDLFTQLAKAIS